jgi:osmotically-inducible protein OsmY
MEMLEKKQVGPLTRDGFAGNEFAEKDRAVERRLDASLREYFFFAAPHVNFECHDGVVVLRGDVNTFHEKQMAQELARRVEGVRVVVNRLAVGANATSRLVNEAVSCAN